MVTFADWYRLYPRKVAVKAAEKAWGRLSEDARERAMAALPNHVRIWSREHRDVIYIPHPATWLNAGRYDDVFAIDWGAAQMRAPLVTDASAQKDEPRVSRDTVQRSNLFAIIGGKKAG